MFTNHSKLLRGGGRAVPSHPRESTSQSNAGLLYQRETNNPETVPSAGLGLVRSFAIGSDCSAEIGEGRARGEQKPKSSFTHSLPTSRAAARGFVAACFPKLDAFLLKLQG